MHTDLHFNGIVSKFRAGFDSTILMVPGAEHSHERAVLKTGYHHLNDKHELQKQFYKKVSNSKA